MSFLQAYDYKKRGPLQRDLLNSQRFAQYLDESDTLIKSFQDLEFRQDLDNRLMEAEGTLGPLYESISETSVQSPGFLEAALAGEIDDISEPVRQSIQRDKNGQLMVAWTNSSNQKNWDASTMYGAATDPGTMFGYSGRMGARFAGSFDSVISQNDLLSDEAKELVSGSLRTLDGLGVEIGRDEWGGLGAIGDSIAGAASYVFGDQFGGSRKYAEGGELWYRTHQGDSDWLANPKAREEIANVVINGKQREVFQLLGITKEDITEAPSLIGAMERINVRVLHHNQGVAMADASFTDKIVHDTWNMIKAMPADPDTIMELGAAVILGAATGGAGALALASRRLQGTAARASYAAFNRYAKVNNLYKGLTDGLGTVAGGFETGAKMLTATRKVLTPTTWGEELVLPTIARARALSKEIALDTAEGIALRELPTGSIFGRAIKDSLFQITPAGGRSAAVANMFDGGVGEILAYASTRDEEADYAKFIFGDDINVDHYRATLGGALESLGYGAIYGLILGQGIRTSTVLLTSPAKMIDADSPRSVKDMVAEMKTQREQRRLGIVNSTLLDLSAGGIRSRRVMVENLRSSSIAQGLIDPEDQASLQTIDALVSQGVEMGVDMAKVIRKSKGNMKTLRKLIQKDARTKQAAAKREARRKARAGDSKELQTLTNAAMALNVARNEQYVENDLDSGEEVDQTEALNAAIESSTGDVKAALETTKRRAEEIADAEADFTVEALLTTIENFSDLPKELQQSVIAQTVKETTGLDPASPVTLADLDFEALSARVTEAQEAAKTTPGKFEVTSRADDTTMSTTVVTAVSMSEATKKVQDSGKEVVTTKELEAPVEPDLKQIEATVSQDARKELIKEAVRNASDTENQILASTMTGPDVEAVNIPGVYESASAQNALPAVESAVMNVIQGKEQDFDSRTSVFYSPKSVLNKTQQRYSKLSKAVSKLDKESKARANNRVSKVQKKIDNASKRNKRSTGLVQIQRAILDEFGINVGLAFKGEQLNIETTAEGDKPAGINAAEAFELYKQLIFIEEVSQSVETGKLKLEEDEKFLVGTPSVQNTIVRQALSSVIALENSLATRGIDSPYVSFSDIVGGGWPAGYHNLLHSAFGDAEAIDYSDDGNIMFHLPLLRSMLEERLARSSEDVRFSKAYRETLKKRIARLEETVDKTDEAISPEIKNKLLRHRNAAMLELTASRFIKEASVNTETTTKQVEFVIENVYKGDRDQYFDDQEDKFILGVSDGIGLLPSDTLAYTKLAKQLGISSLVARKDIFTETLTPNSNANRAYRDSGRRELAERVASWAVSQGEDVIPGVSDTDSFSGMSKLWDGSVDAVDGYTAGRALVEAVTNDRDFGSVDGASLVSGTGINQSNRGYLGLLGTRGWMQNYERFVQDKVNEHILFDENGNAKLYTEEDIEARLAYYDNIERIIKEKRWDELADFVQDTPYQADLKRGIAPEAVIKDLEGEIKSFRKKYEDRKNFVKYTPSSIIHTLHDQAVSHRSSAAAYHIFGNLPEMDGVSPTKALVNAVGDSGLKTAGYNPGSFKDAWQVKSSQIFPTSRGMSRFARATGRYHLSQLMEKLGDEDIIGLLTGLNDLSSADITLVRNEDGTSRVVIENDEDASAQAVTIAQSIYNDHMAGTVFTQIEQAKLDLERLPVEIKQLEFQSQQDGKNRKLLSQLNALKDQLERAKRIATIKIDLEQSEGESVITNIVWNDASPKDVPGLDQAAFRDFLKKEINSVNTIGGGKQTAAALHQFIERYASEKGIDSYSKVGMATLKDSRLNNEGWRVIINASNILEASPDSTFTSSDVDPTIGKWLRKEIFKPPVMTKVYSAGVPAFIGNTTRALRLFNDEILSSLPKEQQIAFTKAYSVDDGLTMARDLVSVLVGNKEAEGTIKSELGLPDTDELIAFLEDNNAYSVGTVLIEDGEGGVKGVNTSAIITQADVTREVQNINENKELRDSLNGLATYYFGKDIENVSSYPMLGLWVAQLEMAQSTGEISRKQKFAAIERILTFAREAQQTALESDGKIAFEDALRSLARPVNGYLQSVELMNKTSYLAHEPTIKEYMDDLGIEEDDLDALGRLQLLHKRPVYARNRTSTGRSFKFLDSTAAMRPLSGESSTHETIGLGNEQLGTLDLGDSFTSLMRGITPDSDGAMNSVILQDMEMELGGILKPMDFDPPTEQQYVNSVREYNNSEDANATRSSRKQKLLKLDNRISAIKAQEKTEEGLSDKLIRELGRLEEIKKLVLAQDDKGRTREQLNRTFIPTSIRPERRTSSPDVRRAADKESFKTPQGKKDYDAAREDAKNNNTTMVDESSYIRKNGRFNNIRPTQMGVPALQALRTRLHSRDLRQLDSDRRALESLPRTEEDSGLEVNPRATFSVAEMVTASPVQPAFVRSVVANSNAQPNTLSSENLEGSAGRGVYERSEDEVKLEVEQENVEIPGVNKKNRVSASRSALLVGRLKAKREQIMPNRRESKSSATRRAGQRKRMRSVLQEGLTLTMGGIAPNQVDKGRKKYVIPRAKVAPGRQKRGGSLTTFGELVPNYGAANKEAGLVGLALGPVEGTGMFVIRGKGIEEVVPKLTSRGPVTVFFHDYMLIGGANKDFTAKALIAMYNDRALLNVPESINNPKDFIAYVNEQGFMSLYTTWNETRFGTDTNVSSSRESLQQDVDSKLAAKVEFWDNFEDVGNYEAGNDPGFLENVDAFYESVFEELGTAFPELPRLKMSNDGKVLFYGIYDSLGTDGDPAFREWFYSTLKMDVPKTDAEVNAKALDVAVAFAMSADEVSNQYFTRLLQENVDGSLTPTTFGARYNGVEIDDPTIPSQARPTFTSMQQLHMMNLSGNLELMHKLLTAAQFGVNIELDLANSQRIKDKSDRFDTVDLPAHGFYRTPLNEDNAAQLRTVGKTDTGFVPRDLGDALYAEIKESTGSKTVITDDNTDVLGMAHLLLASGLVDKDGTVHEEAKIFYEAHGITKKDLQIVAEELGGILEQRAQEADEFNASEEMHNESVAIEYDSNGNPIYLDEASGLGAEPVAEPVAEPSVDLDSLNRNELKAYIAANNLDVKVSNKNSTTVSRIREAESQTTIDFEEPPTKTEARKKAEQKDANRNVSRRILVTEGKGRTAEGDAFDSFLNGASIKVPQAFNMLGLFRALTGRDGGEGKAGDREAIQLIQLILADRDFGKTLFGGRLTFSLEGETSVEVGYQRSTANKEVQNITRTFKGVQEVANLLEAGEVPAALSMVIHELGESTLVVANDLVSDIDSLSTEPSRNLGAKKGGNTRSINRTFLRDFSTVEGIQTFELLVDSLGIRNKRITRFIDTLKSLQKRYSVTEQSLKNATQGGLSIFKQMEKDWNAERKQGDPVFSDLVREAFTHTMTGILLTKAGDMDVDARVALQKLNLSKIVKIAAQRVFEVMKTLQELVLKAGEVRTNGKDSGVTTKPWGWLDPERSDFFEKQWKTIKDISERAELVYSASEAGKLRLGKGQSGVIKTVYLGGPTLPEIREGDTVTAEIEHINEQIADTSITAAKRISLMRERAALLNELDSILYSSKIPEHQARAEALEAEFFNEDLGVVERDKLSKDDRDFLETFYADKALRNFMAKQSSAASRNLSGAVSLLTATPGLTQLPGSSFDEVRALTVAANPLAINSQQALEGWVPQQLLSNINSRNLQRFYNHMGSYYSIFNKALTSKDVKLQSDGLELQRKVYEIINISNKDERNKAIEALDVSSIVPGFRQEGKIKRLKADLTAVGTLVHDPQSGLITQIAEHGYRSGMFSRKQADKIKKVGHLPFLLKPDLTIRTTDTEPLIEKMVNRGFVELTRRYDSTDTGVTKGVYLSRQALVGSGAVMTEAPKTASAVAQFEQISKENPELAKALLELGDAFSEKPEDWDSYSDASKAAWASQQYLDEVVKPFDDRLETINFDKDHPILMAYKEALDSRVEYSWNGERDGDGNLTGMTRAALLHKEWVASNSGKNNRGDVLTTKPNMGFLENFALKEEAIMKHSGQLVPDNPIFGNWGQFFSGVTRKGTTRSVDPELPAFQNYDLLQVVGSLFKGSTGNSFNTSAQQTALGMQGMNYDSLLRHLRRKLDNEASLFSVQGKERSLTKLEREQMARELDILEEQNDGLFLRNPKTVDKSSDASGEFLYDISVLGVNAASAGNWAVSVFAEVTSGAVRSIKRLFSGDLAAITDYVKALSPAARQRALESINAHEFALHNIGQASQLGDIGFDVVDDASAVGSEEVSLSRKVGRATRQFATIGFGGVNKYTRYVSTAQGIRDVRRFASRDKLTALGTAFDELNKAVLERRKTDPLAAATNKEIRAAARKAGMPIDMASMLFNSGANTSTTLKLVDDISTRFLLEDGFDYEGFYGSLLTMNPAESSKHQAAAGYVTGLINAVNQRNNLDPTFGNRQMPRNMGERLLASLGQYPILAYARMRQHSWQGGIAGVTGFLVPLLLGELFYATVKRMYQEEPEDVLEEFLEKPQNSLLNAIQDMPMFGRLQVLQPVLINQLLKALDALDVDFFSGYKKQTLRHSLVGIPGLEMAVASFEHLLRGTEALILGDVNEGVDRILRAGPVPAQPILRSLLNFEAKNEALLSGVPGRFSNLPNIYQGRFQGSPYGDYLSANPTDLGSIAPSVAARGRAIENESVPVPEAVAPERAPEALPEAAPPDTPPAAPPEQPPVQEEPEEVTDGLDAAGASKALADKGLE